VEPAVDIFFGTFVIGISALLTAGVILDLPRLGRAALFALMIGSVLMAAPEDTARWTKMVMSAT
jgi:hypothetical protein